MTARLMLSAAILPLTAMTLSAGFSPALAQAAGGDKDVVTVIGGRAPGASVTDRPVTRLGREDIEAAGFADLGDALAFLPSITGSEFNEDPGTQNDTSGTSSVNLRGLGLGSTLVLMNGQRQTVASVSADDGASFVDLNALVPGIAISRVEVLKDGASPVYGSDAVAGVVNVMTRDDFSGFELTAELRGPAEYDGSGAGYELAAIAGGEITPGLHLTAAVEWLDRQGLEGFETDFVPGTGLSLGQPGSYLVPSRGMASYADPLCEAGGGILNRAGPDDATGTPGSCQVDYGQFFSLVTQEERLQAFAALTGDAGDVRYALRVSGADQSVERGNSPSLPNLNFPLLDAGLPGNPFGEDVVWLGRPLGASAGAARRRFNHETWRVAGEIAQDVSWGAMPVTLELNTTYSRNDLRATITDTLADNFDAALAGFGGADCPGAGAASAGDQSAGCYYFNPFGSGAVVRDPADPRYNSPAVLDYIIGEDVRSSRADLGVVEAVASTPALAALPAGDVSAALGLQLRRETLRVDHGADFNADNFLFIIGGPDYEGERDAHAVFADAIVPVTNRLELQLAARYEDIDGFASTDPKIAAVFEASDALTLRASWAQSFRAPSLHQQVSATTTLQSLNTGSASSFLPVRTVGNPDLDPETADTWTAGAVWQARGLTANIDLWRAEYDGLIVKENPNAILAADLADDGIYNDPRVELSSIGDVRLVRARFVNAPSLEAQGLDAGLTAAPVEIGLGSLGWGVQASYIDEFTLTDPVLGTTVDAAGNRNFTNFARSVPDWRASAWLDWRHANWQSRAGLRHIASYADDENGGATIDAWTVLDLQLAYNFDVGPDRGRLVLGALNLTNEPAPFVDTPLGYDTKVHDPRGRVAYLRVEFAR